MPPGRAIRGGWPLVCLGVLMLACVVRLYDVTQPVLWMDEAYSVTLAAMPPSQIVLHAARDVHPPLYYVLLHFWMAVFGKSLLAVRGLSVLCGSLTVLVAMAISVRLANRRTALIAGILLALLPIAVRYSQEVRMYALTGLLLFCATLMLLRWVMKPDRHVVLVGYGLFMTAALYSHYFAILAVVTHWLYLLFIGRIQNRPLIRSRQWWLCNLMVGLGYVPWLPSLWGQLGHTPWVSWIPEVTAQTLPSTLWLFFGLGAGEDYSIWLFWLIPLAILVATCVPMARDPLPSKPVVLIFCMTYVPLFLAWLGSYIMPLYTVRYLSVFANGLPILIALLLAKVAARSRLWWLPLMACLAWQGAGLNRLYSEQIELNGMTDWRDIRLDVAVEHLNQRWQVGDAIVVDNLFWYYTVQYYNKTGSEALVYQNGERGDNSGRVPSSFGWKSLIYPKSEQLYVTDLRTLNGNYGRVWWVSVLPSPDVGQLPDSWTLEEQYKGGQARASLFTLSQPSLPQAAASLCGSKLSARAICHMRE